MWSAFLVGLLAYTLEIALIITPAVFGLTLAGLPGGYPDLAFAIGWSLAIGWPLLLEMIAMTAALALNPERLGTTRRRKALVKAGRYALTLDFLFRSPGAAKGAGQRLMTSLTADWRRHNAIVIGYPPPRASSASTSSWAPAATTQATATENAAWPSTPSHHRNGHVEPDHPQLAAVHTGALLGELPGQVRSRWPAVASRGI